MAVVFKAQGNCRACLCTQDLNQSCSLSQCSHQGVQYVQMRVDIFPDSPIKPKHHFLLHYPDLILKFGPLIHLWTMRFESKHTYFKQCARKLHNFKNLSSTLAERHQLLQAYLHAGNVFPPVLQVGQANEFNAHMYNFAIQEAVRLSNLTGSIMETAMVTYKGTTY